MAPTLPYILAGNCPGVATTAVALSRHARHLHSVACDRGVSFDMPETSAPRGRMAVGGDGHGCRTSGAVSWKLPVTSQNFAQL